MGPLKRKKDVRKKCSLVIQNFLVSMAAHYATLKNGGIRTKVLISLDQLILDY